MNSKQREKLNDYFQHTYSALGKYIEHDYDSACNKLRMSAEAFCKIHIYGIYGEADGEDIIQGRMDSERQVLPSPHMTPFLTDLISIIKTKRTVLRSSVQDLYDIKGSGNDASHDSNAPLTAKMKEQVADKAVRCSRTLSSALYTYLGESFPQSLQNAYNGVIDDGILNSVDSPVLDDLMARANYFNATEKYILLAPMGFRREEKGLMGMLDRVPWSMVVDLDPNTKLDGLYAAFQPSIDHRCTPLIIGKADISVISNSTRGNVNWVYATGLSDIPNSLALDARQWRIKGYNKNMTEILKKHLSANLSGIYVISLFDDMRWLKAFISCLEATSATEFDLVHFIVISSDEAFLKGAEELQDEYPFTFSLYNISRNVLFSRLSQTFTLNGINSERNKMVPCGTTEGSEDIVDVGDIYSRLCADDIDIVYLNIAGQRETDSVDTPSFYFGNTIMWEELSANADVPRARYPELRRKVENGIRLARKSSYFHLCHKPGAGGTTLSLRLAFDLRKRFPVILIHKYHRHRTMDDINLLYNKVKRNILAIVESSEINQNSIDELVRECNSQKRVVFFVVVERNYKKMTVHNNTRESIEDKMTDADEKSGFLAKARSYSTNATAINELAARNPKDCEVIDFALSIAESHYSPMRIAEYIKSYTKNMTDQVVSFLRLVCFVYHYAQKPLSSNLFRKEFKDKCGNAVALLRYLAIHDDDGRCLRKLLTRISDGEVETVYWRPRYAAFADATLDVLAGGSAGKWKEMIPEYAKSLIDIVRENNTNLADDTRDMLVAVFLQRGKEDPLGKEEEWNDQSVNDHFSQLIQDMGDRPEEQRLTLKNLAESFPDQPHFWGHLARFCYEKANTPEEFDKAMEYIQKAFEVEKTTDYNLRHIAGMCVRRKIEYYKRNGINLGLDSLQEMTEQSKAFFTESRGINNQDIYAYISEIQLLNTVIEFGKEMSGTNSYSEFLLDPRNSWFLRQYDIMSEVIDEANMLIDQMRALEVTHKVRKSIVYLTAGEASSNTYFSNYRQSLRGIKERIDQVDVADKPRLRLLYIKTLLLSKVHGRKDKVMEAWEALSENEIKEVDSLFTKNIQQGGANVFSLRLWFQFVRYANINYDLDAIKSRLKLELNNSEEHQLLKLESAYYLYILNAFELIRDNGSLNTVKLNETNHYINIAKSLSVYDKYSYEFLKSLDGIGGILNYKLRKEGESLLRVKGIVTKIKDERQGIIEMDNGLTAFFSPTANNIVKGINESQEVSFIIGFRHDGLYAFDVRKLGDNVDNKIDGDGFDREINLENEFVEVDDQGETAEEMVVPEVPMQMEMEKEGNKDSQSQTLFKLPSETPPRFKVLDRIPLDELNRRMEVKGKHRK